MKCKALFILLFLPICTSAQNLVPNGSFEEYEECPNMLSQINLVLGWDSILNSADYYNSCSELVSVPNNSEAFQYAFNGSGYVGLYTYNYPPEIFYREVFGTTLLQPLEIGVTYYFSFRLNKGDKSTNQKSSNNLGIKFLTEIPLNAEDLIDNSCHWKIDSICYDTLNWNLIKGQFTADEAYEKLCVGNFFDNEHTQTDGPGTIWDRRAYYLIDDFRISVDSAFAWPVLIAEIATLDFEVFPTVTSGSPISLKGNGSFKLALYDIRGRKLLGDLNVRSETRLDISTFDNGLYLLFIENENGLSRCFKIIKNSRL